MQRLSLLFLGGGLLLLAYVQLQISGISCGYRLEALKEMEAEFLDQHRVLQYNVLILRSPVILSKRLGEQKIQLKPPRAVELLPGKVTHSLSSSLPVRSPQARVPTFLKQAGTVVARWIEGGRQAEAEPVP